MDFRAQFIFDEILEIADGAPSRATGDPGTGEATARVQAEKLRIDARKWLLARMAPKRYGDKITQEISGPDGRPIQTESNIRGLEEFEAVKSFVEDLREQIHDPELRARLIESLPGAASEDAKTLDRVAGVRARLLAEQLEQGMDAASTVQPPASFRGMGSEE